MKTPESFRLARVAVEAAEDKLGRDIVAFDVRTLTSVAEVFLFIGATSHLHVRALEDELREKLRIEGANLLRTDGQRGHLWRVLDYGFLLIHIMDDKTRQFYAIERLWEQGKTLSFSKPIIPVKKKAAPKKKKTSAVKKVARRKKTVSRKKKVSPAK